MAGELADLFHGGSDTGLLLLIAGLAWFFKRQLKIYDKHIETCDQVPRGLILAKLDTVSDRMNELQRDFKVMAGNQNTMAVQVSELSGRQIERDHRE